MGDRGGGSSFARLGDFKFSVFCPTLEEAAANPEKRDSLDNSTIGKNYIELT